MQGFHLVEWLTPKFLVDKFVMVKMGLDSAEFELLLWLFAGGSSCPVNELSLDHHFSHWQKTFVPRGLPNTKQLDKDCLTLFTDLQHMVTCAQVLVTSSGSQNNKTKHGRAQGIWDKNNIGAICSSNP
jgi:hypothetical protein